MSISKTVADDMDFYKRRQALQESASELITAINEFKKRAAKEVKSKDGEFMDDMKIINDMLFKCNQLFASASTAKLSLHEVMISRMQLTGDKETLLNILNKYSIYIEDFNTRKPISSTPEFSTTLGEPMWTVSDPKGGHRVMFEKEKEAMKSTWIEPFPYALAPDEKSKEYKSTFRWGTYIERDKEEEEEEAAKAEVIRKIRAKISKKPHHETDPEIVALKIPKGFNMSLFLAQLKEFMTLDPIYQFEAILADGSSRMIMCCVYCDETSEHGHEMFHAADCKFYTLRRSLEDWFSSLGV